MAAYKTPGVYIEEISTLPPSVAEVATAVPAFLGYTEKGGGTVARIDTLLEYRQLFGGPGATAYEIATEVDAATNQAALKEVKQKGGTQGHPDFLMYYCLNHYFNNGGGSCYVVSVGEYTDTPTDKHFEAGLESLEKEDEPTLIVLTDAVNLDSGAYYPICEKALAQCAKLGDRFAILDVKDGEVATFRDKIGSNALKYAAAYHPYLQTSLALAYDSDKVTVSGGDSETATWTGNFGGVAVTHDGSVSEPQVKVVKGSGATTSFEIADDLLTMQDVGTKTGNEVVAAWTEWAESNSTGGFSLAAHGDGQAVVPSTSNANVSLQRSGGGTRTLKSIEDSGTVLASQIKTALAAQRAILPPSAAMAGIYARVDRERGVWKAPANVSVLSTIGPVTKITHEEQENLNVDATAGTSINVIRAFAGKGTLVWGARTLAGNDNEWRYVSVRRLFNMIEESTRKASSFAVFEPNDASTWLKVKGMIDSYLYGLWESGALAGPTPESAYYVNVGLGKTMTAQDVLEGRMIVEIGVAAVRPAEFIIIRFSHKMQEA